MPGPRKKVRRAASSPHNVGRRTGSKTTAAPNKFDKGEERFRSVVEAAPNAMVMVDRKGKIVLVNKQTETLFGYRRTELLGRPVEMLVPTRFRGKHEGYRSAFYKSPEARAMGVGRELYGYRKNGAEVPIEIGLNPIETSDGLFVLAAIVDITERKRAAGLFQVAVEAAPNAMVMADQRGKIVLVNSQAEALFGWRKEEFLGRSVETLIPERFRKRHAAYRNHYNSDPAARSMGAGRNLFAVRKDGTEVPVEIGLSPIDAPEGRFTLASVVDISERLELQNKLAQSEALAAVGTMAAVMAHEIRNPLGSILMAAKSIGRGSLNPEDLLTVSNILSVESRRLNRLLQDFLQFARPREPKRELSDLNHQVAEIIQTLSSDEHFNVQLDVSLDNKLPRFPYDPDQIRQVLWNLMINGIQAMDGKGRLKVATAAAEDEVSVQIVDSGPGIPQESLKKIFEPFYTTKRKGTGLGLAIAQRIIQAHGGKLTADNEPGYGARFRMVVPLKPADWQSPPDHPTGNL